MVWIILLALLTLLFLAALIWSYGFVFYSPRGNQNDDYAVIESRQMRPYLGRVRELIGSMLARPCERVTIRSRDGLRLSGRFYGGPADAPLVLCFHGYRGTAVRDFCGGAQLMLDRGYRVLAVDERAHGQSEGHSICFGLKERYDVLDWAEYAVKRFGPETEIALMGISMGAATVLMATELPLPEQVKCVLADCPYTSPRAIIREVARQMKLPAELCARFAGLVARLLLGVGLDDADAAGAVRHAGVPILLIHGDDDRFVPYEMGCRIAAAAPERIRFETFPGAGHGMSFLTDEKRYTELVDGFCRGVFGS
ncbi:MAG: lysophospholipase [Oscillospiraceae bacterium]|nr:lysophospholipase [Oscillospiraceae bacterium]